MVNENMSWRLELCTMNIIVDVALKFGELMKLTQERLLKILRDELPFFAAEFGVKRMGIFGSYAKGSARVDSDIDILVEFDRPIGLKFVEFGEYLDNLLGQKTDILTPDGIKGIRVDSVAQEIEETLLYV